MQNRYDDILIKGLTLYMNLESSKIPEENEIDHTFSEKYEKSKRKVIQKIAKPYWKYTNTIAKKVAIVTVTLIIAVSSLFSVKAVRKKIVDFFYNIFETHISILPNNEFFQEQIFTHYTINDIPKTYTIALKNTAANSSTIIWESSRYDPIILQQHLLHSSASINTENTYPEERIINDIPCLFIHQDFAFIYCWKFDNYNFTLTYPIEFGEEFAESVIGNLARIED